MKRPSRNTPSRVSNTPPITTAAITNGSISPALRSRPMPMAARLETIPATVTLMGPVGPLTWAGVPPSKAARNPVTMAPYRP